MRIMKLLPVLLLFAAMAGGCLTAQDKEARQRKADDEVPGRLVYEVHEVTVRAMESYPEQLSITARGTTRTGGWKNPQLHRRGDAKDGVYEFNFIAEPPQGLATQMVSPITATLTMKKPADFRAVRVFAETNEKSAK